MPKKFDESTHSSSPGLLHGFPIARPPHKPRNDPRRSNKQRPKLLNASLGKSASSFPFKQARSLPFARCPAKTCAAEGGNATLWDEAALDLDTQGPCCLRLDQAGRLSEKLMVTNYHETGIVTS